MSPSGSSVAGQLAEQGVEAAGEEGAAGVDADERRDPRASGFFSAISCAIRLSVRRRSSCSSTTFSLTLSLPSWPHWTGLKDARSVAARVAGPVWPRPHELRGGLASTALPGARRRSLGSVRDELGVAPLRERDLDQVEVAGGDGGLEDLLGLLEHLADVVAGGDVDQGEHLHVGLAGDRGGLADGRVAGFGGALDLLLGEAGVVDQQLGVGGGGHGRRAGRGVAGDDDRAARARLGPDHLLGRGPGRTRPATSSPRCSAAKAGPSGTPSALGGLDVEAARALLLDQRVAVGAHAVRGLEGLDLVVVVARPPRPGSSSTSSSSKRSRPTDRLQDREEVAQPAAARGSSAAARGRSGRRSSAAPAGRGCGRRGSG